MGPTASTFIPIVRPGPRHAAARVVTGSRAARRLRQFHGGRAFTATSGFAYHP